jgi:hypothetical protein
MASDSVQRSAIDRAARRICASRDAAVSDLHACAGLHAGESPVTTDSSFVGDFAPVLHLLQVETNSPRLLAKDQEH